LLAQHEKFVDRCLIPVITQERTWNCMYPDIWLL